MLDTDIYDTIRMWLDTKNIAYMACDLTRTFLFDIVYENEISCRYHLRVARGTLWIQAVYRRRLLPTRRLKEYFAGSADAGLKLDISRGEFQYLLRIPCDEGWDSRFEEALKLAADRLHGYYTEFRGSDSDGRNE